MLEWNALTTVHATRKWPLRETLAGDEEGAFHLYLDLDSFRPRQESLPLPTMFCPTPSLTFFSSL